MHEVLVRKSKPAQESVVRLTDHPDMILDVYRGRKTRIQQQQQQTHFSCFFFFFFFFCGGGGNLKVIPRVGEHFKGNS